MDDRLMIYGSRCFEFSFVRHVTLGIDLGGEMTRGFWLEWMLTKEAVTSVPLEGKESVIVRECKSSTTMIVL